MKKHAQTPLNVPCAILLGACLIALPSCRSGHEPSKNKPSIYADEKGNFSPAKMWHAECSTCHDLDKMGAATPESLKNAIQNVHVMSAYSQILSDADITALAGFMRGGAAESRAGGGFYAFISAKTCGSCHDQNFNHWRHSMHALAHSEPLYDAYFIKASQDSGKELEVFCASCHTPIGVLDKEIPFPQPLKNIGDTRVSEIASDGVQCDFCHSISSSKPGKPGNASYVVTRSNVKYGPFKDAVSSFHETAYSKLHTSAEFCGNCHDVDHPGNGIPLETTYKEWKNGPYAAEGVTCQDCHMSRGLTKFEASPGKAALSGPDRSHVSLHYFAGPNLLFKNVKEAPELRALSEKLLRSAAEVKIADLSLNGSSFKLTVDVTNKGAGHSIPTGVTEIRQAWLEITAADASGKVFFHSGALDAQGNIAASPEPILYYTWVKNAQGQFTTQFWNAVEKTRDHRIPPRATLKESVSMPARKGKITITVKLQYRSVSPAGLEEVNAAGTLGDIPVFTMANDARSFSF
jgi:mono/diheme cytochrome c family protein